MDVNNITLTGSGWGTILDASAGQAYGEVIDMNAKEYITIQHLKILGNPGGGAAENFIGDNDNSDYFIIQDCFFSGADNYVIYLAGNGPLGNQRINSAEGCLLYVGTDTTTMTVESSYVDVKVKTVAGDDVTFYNFPVGEYLPIQILQLYATGTTDASDSNCLAIW